MSGEAVRAPSCRAWERGPCISFELTSTDPFPRLMLGQGRLPSGHAEDHSSVDMAPIQLPKEGVDMGPAVSAHRLEQQQSMGEQITLMQAATAAA